MTGALVEAILTMICEATRVARVGSCSCCGEWIQPGPERFPRTTDQFGTASHDFDIHILREHEVLISQFDRVRRTEAELTSEPAWTACVPKRHDPHHNIGARVRHEW